MLIGYGENMTPIDVEFTRLMCKVTEATFVKKICKHDFADYLEKCLSQSFYISYADWS